MALGPTTLPVAFAPLRGADPHLELVVAVPLLLEQRRIARGVDRLAELILLSTLSIVGTLALAGAWLARAVARPVRELVAATGSIGAGDYETRLAAGTDDELGDLVRGFNTMASALSRQRADLERRREYMERLLRYATTGVLSTDTEGRVVTVNPAARSLLQETGAKLAPGQQLVESLKRTTGLEPLAHALGASVARSGESIEVDLEHGEPRRLRFVRVVLRDPAGGAAGSLILLDDVTDLMRSNQLAAWAEMARAIAHEIKNPLTPIQLSTEHLRRLLTDRGSLPDPEIESCLESVIKQVRSLREIAGEFSTFARLPDLTLSPEDPAELLREVAAPYAAAPPPGLRVEQHYEGTLPRVLVDRRVISRALINLIENALQAMPEGGTLQLSAERLAGRDEIALTIADSGTGLDPDVRRRLFEPYFSTKSSGTGLGLAIVRRAVEAHHGRIEVESEPGRGTAFRVVLETAARERPSETPPILTA
jgi:nitrogen fixation/metabolism regulation signal transduction histidine kinase